MARALDDAVIVRQPRRLETLERRGDIALAPNGLGQRRRVVRRLRHAGRHMRARDKCRVADDRDAAERHARRFQDRRSAAGSARRSAARSARNCGASSRSASARISAMTSRADQRRRDRDRMRRAALVGEQPWQFRALVRRPVPDHVVAAVPGPQVVVRPRHRIAEELLARRQAERHELEQVAMHVAAERRFPRSARARRCSRHRAARRPAAHCCRTVERMPSAPTSRSASIAFAIGKMRDDACSRPASKPASPRPR